MANLDFIDTKTSDIYDLVINMLEEGVDDDLYPGDERRIFAEALVLLVSALFQTVNDSCRQRMLRYARGTVLDAIGDTRGVYRISADKATVTERFILSTALAYAVAIPAGTRVTCDYDRYFETIEDAVIPAGDTYAEIEVYALEGGEKYNNIPTGALSILVDQIPYVSEVTNIDVTDGGTEEEEDERYRERIRTGTSMYSWNWKQEPRRSKQA